MANGDNNGLPPLLKKWGAIFGLIAGGAIAWNTIATCVGKTAPFVGVQTTEAAAETQAKNDSEHLSIRGAQRALRTEVKDAKQEAQEARWYGEQTFKALPRKWKKGLPTAPPPSP